MGSKTYINMKKGELPYLIPPKKPYPMDSNPENLSPRPPRNAPNWESITSAGF